MVFAQASVDGRASRPRSRTIESSCTTQRAVRRADLRRRFNRRGESGQTLVEFALVAPLLIVFIFGIIDFGFVFSNYESLRGGTGAAARVAAVTAVPYGTTWTYATSGCTLTGGGLVANSVAEQLMCDAKNLISLNQANTRVSIAYPNTCTADALGTCTASQTDASSTYWPGNSIVICTQYPVSSATGIFGALLNGKVLTSKLELRIEQQPTSTQIPSAGMGFTSSGSVWKAQETPLSSSWPSSCTTP